jgi:hypothetical protein
MREPYDITYLGRVPFAFTMYGECNGSIQYFRIRLHGRTFLGEYFGVGLDPNSDQDLQLVGEDFEAWNWYVGYCPIADWQETTLVHTPAQSKGVQL